MISKKRLEPKRKKNGPILVVLAIMIIALLVVAFYFSSVLQSKIIEIGDCAQVQYIGKFASNGTIFAITYASSSGTIGTPQNLFINPNKNLFVPSKCGATVEPTYVPPEAIRALVGMKEGETKKITLSPADAYGDWNTSLADQYGLKIGLVNEIWDTTVEGISTAEFSYFFPNVTVKEGTIFDYWAFALRVNGVLFAKITNIANGNVTFEMLPINGTTFVLPPFNWPVTILVTNSTEFTIHSDIPPNHTFIFQDPSSGKILYGKVISVDQNEAIIGLNAIAPSIEFVGQSLEYEFKVVRITKTH